MIKSTHCRHSVLLRFGHGPILVQMSLQHSQAQPYSIRTRVVYFIQTLNMWSISLWYDLDLVEIEPETFRTLSG